MIEKKLFLEKFLSMGILFDDPRISDIVAKTIDMSDTLSKQNLIEIIKDS